MSDPDPKYFDYSASKPPYVRALEIQREIALKYFANPSSSHMKGKQAKIKFNDLKEQFCNFLNFRDGRLLLCSSGTEANNLIIEGHLSRNPSGTILIAENIHDSIWYAAYKHKDRVRVIRPGSDGRISAYQLKKSSGSGTSLFCISHVCNETGSVQDIERLSDFCRNNNIRMMVDGVQAVGNIPVNMEAIQSDYYTFSAHKFGGPRSVGGILMRDDAFTPLLYGGKQEWGLRAGTENLAGLAGSVAALEESLMTLDERSKLINNLKTKFIKILESAAVDFLINSTGSCLPGFISISFPGMSGTGIVAALATEGFSVATGSACQDNITMPPRVIMAIGRSEKQAMGTIRITMGRGNTELSMTALSRAILENIH
jgi:cysteine desulfurase